MPENEELRLERLRHYSILDSKEEAMFDDLTKLAARILDVPICLLSFVDEDRQWFKSRLGTDTIETDRDISFCQYTIMGEDTFVVNDALEDDRFKDSPLVTDGDKTRFYAGTPLIDEYGAALGSFCAIDSSPRELTEDQQQVMELISKTIMNLITLRREKLETEKLSKVKDEFLSNMSHEIRTPLNAIIGFNDLLSKTVLTQEQKDYLDTIATSSQNLKVIINDVLDVAKLESGNLKLEMKSISLNKLMDHVIKLQGPQAKERGLKLISSIDHEIPPYVLGDETRLTQILINLVSNAIKFTKKGFVELRAMAYEIKEGKANISFSVKDTGIGIPEDKLKIIFERFSQAETSTTRLYGGTGLGLNIVDMLVRLHNGKLTVDSERDKGSEFKFEITFDITNGVPEIGTTKVVKKQEKPIFKGDKILLVEDNIHNQLLARNYYKRWGTDIDIAENGAIALDMLAETTYDIILMDLQMPVMDGFTTTKKIRKELKLKVPIVGCSAHSLVGEKEKCISIGMDDYIAKPYTEDELIRTTFKHLHPNKKEAIAIEKEAITTEVKEGKEESNVELSTIVFDDFDTLIKNLTEQEGNDFVAIIKRHFNKRTPEDIEEIKRALQEENMDVLKDKSHFIAGSLGVFGFENGHKLAKNIERCIADGAHDKARELGQQLIPYLEEALTLTV